MLFARRAFAKKERERKRVSLSCFKQTRRERENKERNKKCIIPRETREFKEGFVLFTRGLYSSPFRQKREKKLSFLSLFGRFDRYLSLSSPSGCFNIPSSYARENRKPALPKIKNARECGFDTWKTSSLARKLHSRTPRSVRVSLFYSQKQNQTHANSAPSWKVVTRVDFLSLRKRKKWKREIKIVARNPPSKTNARRVKAHKRHTSPLARPVSPWTRDRRVPFWLYMMRLYVYFVKARDVILVYMSWNRAKVQLKSLRKKKTKKQICVFKAKWRKKKFKITRHFLLVCF